MSHPSVTEIEDFVSGAVEPNAELIAHVSACDACAALVRSAARVEVALHETGEAARFCVACGCVASTSRCSSCGAALRVRDYRVEAVLASGPLGRVYAAVDPSGVRVAVKELAFVGMPRAEALEAFEREARVLERLTHAGIPRFVDSFSEGRGVEARTYLVQELIEGESLAARLARQQLSEPEVVEIARQVIDILCYLQSLSPMVFHRDIKPANLIQRPDGSIALVDFGAARDLGSTAGATVVGTFGYMPVEQLAGIVDATTDLHALGATLWHLCTRIEPWRLWADSLLQRRANVSPALRRFLDRLVARDARRRFQSATAARDALASLRGVWGTLRPRLGWAVAAALLIATTTGGFVAARAVGFFTSRVGRLAAEADREKYLANDYALQLAERNLEHEVDLLARDEHLLRNVNAENDDGIAGDLAEALKHRHIDGVVALDNDGKVLASAGMIDPQALAAARSTDPSEEARASARRIGKQRYVVAAVGITYFGRKLAQIVAAVATDATVQQLGLAPEDASADTRALALSRRNLENIVELGAQNQQLLEATNFADKASSAYVIEQMATQRHLDGLVVLDKAGQVLASAGSLDAKALAAARGADLNGVPQSSIQRVGARPCLVASIALTFFGNDVGALVAAQGTDAEARDRIDRALGDFMEVHSDGLYDAKHEKARARAAEALATFNRARHLDGLLLLDAKGNIVASTGTVDAEALATAHGKHGEATDWTVHHIGDRDYLIASSVESRALKNPFTTGDPVQKLGELVVAQAVDGATTTPAAASISVTSTPSGASVTLDDKPVGTTPLRLRSVSAGLHHLTFELAGYESDTVDLKLKAGEESSSFVELAKKASRPEAGKLSVNTLPSSQVFEGERLIGRTPLLHISLPAGAHTLTFVASDHAPVKKRVRIDPGAETTLVFSFDEE